MGIGTVVQPDLQLDPVSGAVITYPFPKGTPPYGLAFDKNKMLWTSLEFADEIVKMDTATGKQTHYKIPTRHGDIRHIQTDAEGNVWAAAQQSDKLIKIDGRTGQVTEYEPPTKLSGVDTVDVDRKRNLIWIGEDQTDKLARFDPANWNVYGISAANGRNRREKNRHRSFESEPCVVVLHGWNEPGRLH